MDIFIPRILLAPAGVVLLVLTLVLIILYQIWRLRRKGRFSPFTEDFFRLPGFSVRKAHSELFDNLTNYYFSFVFLAIFFMGSVLFFESKTLVVLLSVIGIGMIFCLFKIYKIFGKLQTTCLGCEGEEYTGQELNLLMLKGAYVFHDIPYKYGNIDHIVVGNDKIFVVETKAVRKPAKSKSKNKKSASVKFDGEILKFPHFTTSEPIEQAKRHAKFLENVIEEKCGFQFRIIPVVALPGWLIETSPSKNYQVLIINPKRGKALVKWLGNIVEKRERNRVVNYIASVARSVSPPSRKTDPNADKYYDFWFNPRVTEKLLGDEA